MSESRDRLLQAAKELKGWDGPAEVVRGLQSAGLRVTEQQMSNWNTRKVPDRFCHLAAQVIGCSAEWLIFGKVKNSAAAHPADDLNLEDSRPATSQSGEEANSLRAYVDMLRKNAQIIAEQFGVSAEQVLSSALAPSKKVEISDEAVAVINSYLPQSGAKEHDERPTMQGEGFDFHGEVSPSGNKADQNLRQGDRRTKDRRRAS